MAASSKLPLHVRLIAALLVSAAAVLAAQEAGIKIAPRDQLQVTTWNEPTLTGKFQVGADGTFEFPFVGQVKAGGLTTREVEADIKKRLSGKFLLNPQVTVELEQTVNKRVFVTGQGVRSPGMYPYGGSEMTVLDAVTRAGGLTEDATDDALVIRAGDGSDREDSKADDALHVDLHELFRGNVKGNLGLRDGDTVIVNKAEPIYVMGFVKSPGPYLLRRGMTVQQAITLAGGVTDKGRSSGIQIQHIVKGKPGKFVDAKLTDAVLPGETVKVPARIW
jgi:polysaccharide export outer membrane protein